MCLYRNDYLEKDFLENYPDVIVAYKLLERNGNGFLHSPCIRSPVTVYNRGVTCSNRRSIARYAYESMVIARGIHVHLTLEGAKNDTTGISQCAIIPVTCYTADFVGAGACYMHASNVTPKYPEAVFTKVTVEQTTSIDYLMPEEWPNIEDYLLNAHSLVKHNKAMSADSNLAGCFYCRDIYPATEVTHFNSDTAFCPKCGVDSVLFDSSMDWITPSLLHAMYHRWCGR